MRIGKFVDQEDRRVTEGTNICGVLVHARTGHVDAVRALLTTMDGVEVHQSDLDGRLVVTVEDTADEWAGQIITRFPTFDGVLSTSLIYHHCETGDLDKESL
ncbi:MAG TPA: chaperone NapD [Patescibacteria group bacterium]|nr:chaperone NapD [Patescibacteria group bacterium]